MAALQSYFDDFIAKITLQDDLKGDLQEAHQELTERLEKDEVSKPFFIDTFLQGSYKRSTIIDPAEGSLADVDIVAVTNINEEYHPQPETAMAIFVPFLLEQNYKGKWEPQDRSFAIKEGRIKMDLVITSAPSEILQEIVLSKALRSNLTLEDDPELRIRKAWKDPDSRALQRNWKLLMEQEGQTWRDEPLRIPDRTQKCWEPTHPLAQIDWTAEKNARCNSHFLKVVRAIKWWKRGNPNPKYPKGYPLEHLIGDACPDGIETIAEGVVRTLETLLSKWEATATFVLQPELCDHGVDQNVLARVSPQDFADFHALLAPAADIARKAYSSDDKYVSVQLWQKLFGARFPDPPDRDQGGRGPKDPTDPEGGFTPRTAVGLVGGGRFG